MSTKNATTETTDFASVTVPAYPNKLALILKDKRLTLIQVQKGIYSEDGTLQKEGTDISYPVLIDLKKGVRNNFEARTIRQIAEFLDITIEELMGTYVSPKVIINNEKMITRKKKKDKPVAKKAKKRKK